MRLLVPRSPVALDGEAVTSPPACAQVSSYHHVLLYALRAQVTCHHLPMWKTAHRAVVARPRCDHSGKERARMACVHFHVPILCTAGDNALYALMRPSAIHATLLVATHGMSTSQKAPGERSRWECMSAFELLNKFVLHPTPGAPLLAPLLSQRADAPGGSLGARAAAAAAGRGIGRDDRRKLDDSCHWRIIAISG